VPHPAVYVSADGATTVTRCGGPRPVRSLLVDGVVQGDDSPVGVVMQGRLGLLPGLLAPKAGPSVFPSPLTGEGKGGGGSAASGRRTNPDSPSPSPSPTQGGGDTGFNKRAFVVGVGTGITLSALAAVVEGASITAAERAPDILAAADHFREHWAAPIDRPPVTVIAGDGAAVLAESEALYDLILVDLVTPAGSPGLFSRPFYRTAAARLSVGGVTAQWLPLFQVPPPMLRRVVAAFLAEFPESGLWFAAFDPFKPVALLVSGGSPTGVERESAPAAVPGAGLGTIDDVRRLHLLDAAGLRRFAKGASPFEGDTPLVTDDEAADGLADGGRENIEALIDCADEPNPVGCAFLAACRADEAGDYFAALTGYRRVMQTLPDDPLVRLRAADASASVLILQGASLWAEGDVEGAEAVLRRAVATAPDRPDARDALAGFLTDLNRHEEALAEIEVALAIDPDDADLHAGRRAILHNLGRA